MFSFCVTQVAGFFVLLHVANPMHISLSHIFRPAFCWARDVTENERPTGIILLRPPLSHFSLFPFFRLITSYIAHHTPSNFEHPTSLIAHRPNLHQMYGLRFARIRCATKSSPPFWFLYFRIVTHRMAQIAHFRAPSNLDVAPKCWLLYLATRHAQRLPFEDLVVLAQRNISGLRQGP